ncbi:MAG: pentapeptide repeat-containing protein [Streptosporangiaceae bacterium]
MRQAPSRRTRRTRLRRARLRRARLRRARLRRADGRVGYSPSFSISLASAIAIGTVVSSTCQGRAP